MLRSNELLNTKGIPACKEQSSFKISCSVMSISPSHVARASGFPTTFNATWSTVLQNYNKKCYEQNSWTVAMEQPSQKQGTVASSRQKSWPCLSTFFKGRIMLPILNQNNKPSEIHPSTFINVCFLEDDWLLIREKAIMKQSYCLPQ